MSFMRYLKEAADNACLIFQAGIVQKKRIVELGPVVQN